MKPAAGGGPHDTVVLLVLPGSVRVLAGGDGCGAVGGKLDGNPLLISSPCNGDAPQRCKTW